MAFLLNLCLVLIGLAGAGAAVGIPLTMFSKSKNAAATSSENSGGGASAVSVELSECQSGSSDNISTVGFGIQTTDKVCGKVQDNSESLTNKDEYTKLFKEVGGSSSQNGSTITAGNGKTDCSSDGSNWEIWSSGASDEGRNEKDEYLGLCDNATNTSSNLFVKKQEKDNNRTILVCEGVDNCGSFETHVQSTTTSSKRKLESDKSSSGKTVIFQKSN